MKDFDDNLYNSMIFINGALKNASNPLNKKISDIYGDECLYGELNDIIFKNI